MRRKLFVCAVVLLGAWATGCGGSGAKTAPVSGRVTYKGKPVAKANVSFTPAEGASRAATGLTDDGGNYKLGSFAASDGAPPGNYRVTIQAYGPDRPAKPGEGSGMPGETIPGDPIIPAKYFKPETSGLTFEVKPGSNLADFELKD